MTNDTPAWAKLVRRLVYVCKGCGAVSDTLSMMHHYASCTEKYCVCSDPVLMTEDFICGACQRPIKPLVGIVV